MDKIWEEMYNAAKAVLKPITISEYVSAGEVSAAVLSKTGKIYLVSKRYMLYNQNVDQSY